jgi:Inhibitor of vertebrate lysozyme (Ivy)
MKAAKAIILQSFLVLSALLTVNAYANTVVIDHISETKPTIYLFDALKNKTVRTVYKKTFSKYQHTAWVRRGSLGAPADTVYLKNGKTMQVFEACKPHDCADNFLLFAYDAFHHKGWGKVFVRPSGIEALTKEEALNMVFDELNKKK